MKLVACQVALYATAWLPTVLFGLLVNAYGPPSGWVQILGLFCAGLVWLMIQGSALYVAKWVDRALVVRSRARK